MPTCLCYVCYDSKWIKPSKPRCWLAGSAHTIFRWMIFPTNASVAQIAWLFSFKLPCTTHVHGAKDSSHSHFRSILFNISNVWNFISLSRLRSLTSLSSLSRPTSSFPIPFQFTFVSLWYYCASLPPSLELSGDRSQRDHVSTLNKEMLALLRTLGSSYEVLEPRWRLEFKLK